ncbi:DUF1501 domain-containing protein [bacterium]|nr:MAG: DUF1501 domain-containing protein [bacterium]
MPRPPSARASPPISAPTRETISSACAAPSISPWPPPPTSSRKERMMTIARKQFLLGTVSGLALIGGGQGVFGRALAQTLVGGAGPGNRVLVVLNLQGGNDGLNTLVPYGDPVYQRMRPDLALTPHDVLAIDAAVGLNPAMRALKAMYDKGRVAIVQGAGYPNPDHSHFRSTEIWQTADPVGYDATGWLGRLLDRADWPKSLFTGVAVSPVLPELFIAERHDVPAIDAGVRGFRLAIDGTRGGAQDFAAQSDAADLPFRSPFLPTIAEVQRDTQRGSEELPKLVAGYKATASYSATGIGRSLALAAQIIGTPALGTRIIYVAHGSFDTHVSQKATQDRLLGQLSDALAAFYDDLAAHGNDQRVLTMTFSEFGRRVEENASRGTDHGEAGPMFVIGPVRGGLYGTPPSLERLHEGNLAYSTDFRSIYATIIERWLGRSASGVLAGDWPMLPMLG